MKFAYLDSANILHITKWEDTAQRCAKNKKYIETDVAAKGGYPVDEKGNPYVIYDERHEKHKWEIPAELSELYLKLK